MSNQGTQYPVAWRITFKSGNEPDGFSSVHYHETNAIADYRKIYPDAVSEPLYISPEKEALQRQRDELLAALQSISNITGDAGFNIGGPLEHCPGEIDYDEAKRLLSLACEYLKDTSKAASRAIASVKGGACKHCNGKGVSQISDPCICQYGKKGGAA